MENVETLEKEMVGLRGAIQSIDIRLDCIENDWDGKFKTVKDIKEEVASIRKCIGIWMNGHW